MAKKKLQRAPRKTVAPPSAAEAATLTLVRGPRGHCQFCDAETALEGGRITRHGSTDASEDIVACPGTGRLPFEVSCDAVQAAFFREALTIASYREAVRGEYLFARIAGERGDGREDAFEEVTSERRYVELSQQYPDFYKHNPATWAEALAQSRAYFQRLVEDTETEWLTLSRRLEAWRLTHLDAVSVHRPAWDQNVEALREEAAELRTELEVLRAENAELHVTNEALRAENEQAKAQQKHGRQREQLLATYDLLMETRDDVATLQASLADLQRKVDVAGLLAQAATLLRDANASDADRERANQLYELALAAREVTNPPFVPGSACPECGDTLHVRADAHGAVLGCRGYPRNGCRFTTPLPASYPSADGANGAAGTTRRRT